MVSAPAPSAARYSRQNGQPKWRKNATTTGPSRHNADSATSPSRLPNVTSGAGSPTLGIVALLASDIEPPRRQER
jgi:hypothetical protein